MLIAIPCQAADILLALSGPEAPYQQTAKLLEEQLKKSGHRVQTELLDPLKKDQKNLTANQNLIIAVGSKAALALKETASDACPLVFCMVSDPAELKLDQSPNVWGVSMEIPIEDQLQLIGDTLPGPQTIGLLYQDSTPAGRQLLNDIKKQLPKNWKIEAVNVDDKKYQGIADAIQDLYERPIDLVWTYPEAAIFNNATVQQLLLISIRKKIPVYGFSSGFVKAGALMGTSINLNKHGIQTAQLATQIIKNDAPKTPVAISKYDIVLNQIVAERLSITLPKEMIKKADIVYQPEDLKR